MLASLCFLTLVLVNCTNVALRYVWSSPLPWAEEVMICLTLWGVALMFPVLTYQRAHLRINLFDSLMSSIGRRIRGAIENIALIGSAGFVAHQSSIVMQLYLNSGETTTAARMPMWLYQGSFFAGFTLTALAALFSLPSYLKDDVEDQQAVPETAE